MGWSPFRKTGLTYHQPAQSYKGYTLITPSGGDASFLLDMDGRIVHTWRYRDIRPGYARLLPNGNLLARGVDRSLPPPQPVPPGSPPPPFEQHVRRLGAASTHLQELDWEGNVVWQFRHNAIHHDFVRLANGNTLVAWWVELSADLARRVRGGIGPRPREKLPPMLSDDIVEIDPTGREVWRVSLWRLLDPVKDPICPLETRWEWTHLNGLAVTREGDVVFSCRQNSRVGIVERATGKLRWKYGFPDVSHQHNAQSIDNGNILLFDNGMHRVGLPRSRVVEVNPKDNAVVWQYEGEPAEQFFSGHVSGADRLPGGTTLICEGASGRIFEVTQRGEVVWEWVNPFSYRVQGRLLPLLFRAHRYGPDHPAVADRRLDPHAYDDLNRLHGLL
jgi:hypothetical protein